MGTDEFARGMKRMEDLTRGTTRTIVNESEKIDQSFKRLGQVAAGYLTFNQLSQLPGQIVRVRGEFQQLEIALNTMLGSKSKADALMGEIVETAGSTPFGMKDLAAGTKQLLAYGSASETVISEIRMLGDVASGVSVPIGELIYLYGTLRSQGRAYAVDIRQFAGRGIPIYAELAKVLGVQKEEVNALVEAGKVGFPQVEQAFRNMTSAGGMFNNLMADQAKSLPGLIERLKDAVDQMFNDIGRANQGAIEGVISGASLAVEHYQEIQDVLTILIASFGAYRAAVIAAHAINVVSTSSAYIAEAASLSSLLSVEAQARISKMGLAAGSLEHAAAIKAEILALTESNTAQVAGMRLSVATAAAKKGEALDSARNAAAKLAEARVTLATAQANQVATAQFINAKVRENAAREVAKAQEVVIAAQERASITRKAALAASSDFYSKKAALETAATSASTTAKTISAAAEVRLTAAQQLRTAVTTRLIALQTAFNASLLSNPIVLATVALVGMTAAMWALHDGTSAQEKAQEALNKLTEDAARKKQELESRTASLNGVIRDENQTRYAQLKAFTDLQKLYPGILGQMKLHEFQALSTAKAQKILNEAIEGISFSDSKKAYEDAVKRVENLQAHLNRLKDTERGSSGGGDYALVIGKMTVELAAAKVEAEKLGDQIKEEERLGWLANAPNEEKLKYYQSQLESKKKERAELEKIALGANAIKKIFADMSLIGINKEIKDLHGNVKAVQDLLNPSASATDGGNKAHWEQIKKDAEDARALLGVGKSGSAEWKQHTKNIDEANRKLEAYSTTAKKIAEKDKPQPFGSIAYWEQVARKAQEAIDKTKPKTGAASIKKQQEILQNAQLMTEQARLNQMPYGSLPYWEQVQKIANQIISNTPLSDKSGIEKQKLVIANAQRKEEEVRKQLAVRSFGEELESKKQLYELYQRWIDNYGKAAADDQFKDLISDQKNFVDYLSAEIARLEAMKDSGYTGKLNDQDASDLDNLLSLRRSALNQKTSVEQFKDELEEAKLEAKSLAEYLDVLYSKRGNVGDPASASGQAKSVLLNSEIVETEKALKASLIDFQRESATYLQKRILAEQKYNSLRKAAILKYSKEELKTELDNIEKRKKEELEAIADEELERTEAYQRIHEDIKQLSREQLKIRIGNIEQELKNEEISVKKRLELEKALARAKKALNNKSVEDLRIAGSVLSQALGDVTLEFTEQFKLNLRDLGNAIEGVANLASFDFSTASASDKASAIGDIIGIHSFLITTVRDAFKTTEDFYTGMEDHESYYKGLAAEIDGVNILLERQQYLLGNLTGSEKSGGTMALIESYAKAQEDALQGLKDLSIDVIKSADKVFVDPILGTEVKAKGFWGVYTQLATAGKAETKIKYKFENIDTSGYDDIEDFINLLAEIRKGGGKLNGKEVVAADLEALELLIKTYQEAEEKQKQLIDEFRQFLTATTETQIADAIVAGLQAGKSSAADFADDFETMMRNAVVNSLKAQIMDAKLADFYKKMGEYALSDGVISKDEQADLKKDWDGIITGSKQLADTIQQITGVDIAGSAANLNNSLSGSIKGMSEETASVLAGQFNAIRIYNAQIAFDVRGSLLLLTNISNNSNYLRKLETMTAQLDRLIDQKSQSLRGSGFGGL